MADFFADSSLFAEFDKDREAESSFIHYDEDSVKSRIVFEGYESDTEEELDDEVISDEVESNAVSAKTKTNKGDEDSEEHSVAQSESLQEDANVEGKDELKSEASESADKETDVEKSSVSKVNETIAKPAVIKKSEEQLAAEEVLWLNEQLYAEAGEEAKKSNTSLQQLIFERNKFRRYAKILDSTRYVPDDESPAVQLLFNNNAFARKHRQQIEQFIKGLLWEEFHSGSHDSVSEITVKPGAPSCTDINTTLSAEQRSERMRQKHAVLGNSQFHKQFLIDFLGWPFTMKEPVRCNVNWEVPLYVQVFNEVYADPANKNKKPKANARPKPSCWNCNQPNHSVAECRLPRNQARITANRNEFRDQQQQQQTHEPKFTGPSRYHKDPEIASKFSKFRPGTISDELREALGLSSDQLAQHIYKMRLFGYPPGWLAEAKQVESGVTIFDKQGRVALITGECLEDGELDEQTADKNEYDVNKIIEFPGFTVPVPLGIVDEHASFQMPPIQQHQLKKTLMSQSTEKAASRKRKRAKDKEELLKDEDAKKAKGEGEGAEEGDAPEGDANGVAEAVDENAADTQEVVTPNNGLHRSTTLSLSRDYGTPIMVRQKSDLPDASKFGCGIEDHIPFENLPDAVGTFDKMKDLIDIIRKKIKK